MTERQRRCRQCKRDLQVKLQKRVLICILVFVTISMTSFVNAKVEATQEYNKLSTYVGENEAIYYSSIRINHADTLTSISKDVIEEYGMDVPVDVMVRNIAKINKIGNPDYIKSGTYVVVPIIR